MRRLKQELKQTMDMYSTACKEALSAKQKVRKTCCDPKLIAIYVIHIHICITRWSRNLNTQPIIFLRME